MKRSNHLDDRVGAMPDGPRWSAKPEPQSTVRLGPIGRPSLSRFAPIFTHRTHYGAPKARGHRQWMGEKR